MSFDKIKKYLFSEFNESPIYFIILSSMIVLFFLSSIICLLTSGDSFNNFLWFEHDDYFRDFFDSTYYAYDGPYTKWNVIYPGVAMSFYAIVAFVICNVVNISGVPDDLAPYVLRDSQIGLMTYLIIVLMTFVILKKVLPSDLKKKHNYDLFFLFAIILSAPVLQAVERGNNILIVVILCFLFLRGYSSCNSRIRYLSYLSLAFAAGFKLYPEIFALLILKEGRYKDFVICVFISIVVVSLSLFLLGGSPIDLISNILKFSDITAGTRHAVYTISDLMEYWNIGQVSIIITVAFLAITVIITLIDDQMAFWKTLFLLTANLSIGIGIGTPYLACCTLIPFTYFIINENELSRINKIGCICFILTFGLIPIVEGTVLYTLINSLGFFSILLLTIIIIAESINRFIKTKKVN